MADWYLIWSNEHRAWWRQKSQGYTTNIDTAGLYSRDEALRHCRGRDQMPNKPLPEIPVRQDDVMSILVPELRAASS